MNCEENRLSLSAYQAICKEDQQTFRGTGTIYIISELQIRLIRTFLDIFECYFHIETTTLYRDF